MTTSPAIRTPVPAHNHAESPNTATLEAGCPACVSMAEGYAEQDAESREIVDAFSGGPVIRALEHQLEEAQADNVRLRKAISEHIGWHGIMGHEGLSDALDEGPDIGNPSLDEDDMLGPEDP